MASFRKGLEKVNESAQRSTFTGKNRFISWESGETKTIRFLTEGDQIALTSLHEWVPCADGKKRSFVCRREVDAQCELCENPETSKKRDQALAVAVWRVEGKDKDGKTIYKTKTEEVEVEEDGKTVVKVEPFVGIVRQAPGNFWRWFYGTFDKRGTLLDRDYSITRRGKKLDTTYQAYPEDEQELDLSMFTEFMPDLEEFLTWLSSTEYYDRYLHGVDPKAAADEAASEETLTQEDLEAIRAANVEVADTAASGAFD